MGTYIDYHNLGLPADFIFNIEKCPLTHDYFVHHHNFSELVLILEGSAIHVVEGKEYPIAAGHVFVVNEGVNHGYKHVDRIKYVNVMFRTEQLPELPELMKLAGFQAFFLIEPIYRSEQHYNAMLALGPSQMKRVHAALDEILEEFTGCHEGYRSMILMRFSALAITLSRYYTENHTDSNKVYRLAEAFTFLEENFLKPITLKQAADLAYLSPRHFVRTFSRSYKTTPMEYVLMRRLEHSCLLLRDPERSITDVAEQSGFRDANYFARQFRKAYGCSPTEYRRKG
ncbi:AraC family transcriptional regulator [Gorillibacterium sp. sgz5001074]|uniref:AraC family transcriptional regulator n=1 Tax=Gorillibacterium sp. sgz5001074 TaxID=3446695 RepID=UPI003F67C252